MPESEEYDIDSFVYRARRPFDPEKLHAFFNEPWPNVVRAKGFFWLATRPDMTGEVSQAGALVRHQKIGTWWASVPREQWQQSDSLISYWRKFGIQHLVTDVKKSSSLVSAWIMRLLSRD